MKHKQSLFLSFAIFTALLTNACKFENFISMGEKGNGKVISEVRQVAAFNKIKVSAAIHAIVTLEGKELVRVETDENLIDLLKTTVDGDVLKIYFTKNIHSAKKRNVYISAKKLSNIMATSAARIVIENLIDANHISLTSNSAGSIKAEVNADRVTCETSSAGSIEISGKTENFTATASSAGNINSKDLKARDANIRVSSAGSIEAFVIGSITAKASSGGNIDYFGNPEKVSKSRSSGGSISSNN